MLDPTRLPDAARAADPSRHRNAELLAAFDRYQDRHGRAPGTRERYQRVLRHYLAWLTNTDATAVTAADVDRYLDHWQDHFTTNYRRPPAPASYRGQINALRAFYRHLNHLDLLQTPDGKPLPDPTLWIQAPAAHPADNDWLRHPEDHALQTCPGTLQDRFTTNLLRATGIRVSEATSLTRTDLDLTPGQEALTIRTSKTPAGRRTIPLLPDFLPLLQQWLDHLDQQELTEPSTPLLANRHGQPLTHTYIWRIIKRHAHNAGIRPTPCTCGNHQPPHQPGCPRNQNGHNLSQISAHTLRRTYASHLLNQGLRLEIVSKLLGHANTTITQHHYAQLLDTTTRHELYQALKITN